MEDKAMADKRQTYLGLPVRSVHRGSFFKAFLLECGVKFFAFDTHIESEKTSAALDRFRKRYSEKGEDVTLTWTDARHCLVMIG